MATPQDVDEQLSDSPDGSAVGDDFARAQRAVFDEAGVDVQSRFVNLTKPRVKTHVLQAGPSGDEPPILFVHGTTWFGAYFAPLMAKLDDTQLLAIDRPGWGLSETVEYTPGNVRHTATDVLDGILDELGIEQVDLVGNSTGGFWSILFALATPNGFVG